MAVQMVPLSTATHVAAPHFSASEQKTFKVQEVEVYDKRAYTVNIRSAARATGASKVGATNLLLNLHRDELKPPMWISTRNKTMANSGVLTAVTPGGTVSRFVQTPAA